jgi:hypothetical protein
LKGTLSRVSKSRCDRTSFSSGQLAVLLGHSRQAVDSALTDSQFGTSTRVSPGFAPGRQRSRSFGSRRPRSPSVQYPEGYWPRGPDPHPRPVKAKDKVEGPSLSLREGALSFPRTREDAGLLGPCFKTGRRRRRAEDRAGRPRCTPGPFEHSLQDWKNGENPVGFSPSFH